MILPIRSITDPILTQVCTPVDDTNIDLARATIVDLIDTLRSTRGAGLAAPQISVPLEILVMIAAPMGMSPRSYPSSLWNEPHVMVNPFVTDKAGALRRTQEGCLSMPGVSVPVDRSPHVTVAYLDANFVRRAEHFSSAQAVCVQHEMDHLAGVRHIDHLSPMRRAMILKAWGKRGQAAFRHPAPQPRGAM